MREGRTQALKRSVPPIWNQMKRAALLALVAGMSLLYLGCAGIVVEPVDESTVYNSSQKFWGYSVNPGETIRLEGLSSSWELFTSTTSSASPTYTGSNVGHYYELWVYMPSVAARFRRAAPWAGYWMGTFRVTSSGGTLNTRQWGQNNTVPGTDSWLTKYWMQYQTNHGTIDLYYAN